MRCGQGWKPSKSGLVWLRADREKVAQLLLGFFQNDATTVAWFIRH